MFYNFVKNAIFFSSGGILAASLFRPFTDKIHRDYFENSYLYNHGSVSKTLLMQGIMSMFIFITGGLTSMKIASKIKLIEN